MAATLALGNAVETYVFKGQTHIDASRDAIDVAVLSAKKRTVRFDHTFAAGDGSGSVFTDNDELQLCVIPAGVVIDLKQSYFKASANPGSCALKLGTRAWVNVDGTAHAEDAAFLGTILNTANTVTTAIALYGAEFTAGNGVDNLSCVKINSRGPVVLFAKAIANGGTFDADIADVWSLQLEYWAA